MTPEEIKRLQAAREADDRKKALVDRIEGLKAKVRELEASHGAVCKELRKQLSRGGEPTDLADKIEALLAEAEPTKENGTLLYPDATVTTQLTFALLDAAPDIVRKLRRLERIERWVEAIDAAEEASDD